MVSLLARQETRYLGLVVLGYAAARVVASALWIYPLGIGRPDIFSFPVTICLFAAGVHVATSALPNARTARWLAAAAAVTFALIRPVDVGYWDANGQPHLQHLLSHARADDPVMLSPTGALLTAYYGPWRPTTHRTDGSSQGIEVTVDRDRTLYLPRGRRAEALAEEFLGRFPRSDRVWYFGHSVWSDAVVVKMANAGYAVQIVEESDDSRLFLGTR